MFDINLLGQALLNIIIAFVESMKYNFLLKLYDKKG